MSNEFTTTDSRNLAGTKYPIPDDVKDDYEEAVYLLKTDNDAENVLETLLDILCKHPDHPRVLNSIGVAYVRKDYLSRAETYYLRAIEVAPDYVLAYSNLSLIHSYKGDIERGGYYARLAIKHDKHSPVPWNILGSYHLNKGDIRRALEHFLASYNYDNTFCKAAYNAACCYSLLGDKDKALKYLAKSLDTKRRIEKAKVDTDLDNIRKLPEFERIIEEAKRKLDRVEKNER